MTHSLKGDIRIAMVGYYNTLPFLFGLQKDSFFDLILDVPSRCMGYFDDRSVDVALVPVATLLDRTDYKIITDYCIGCVGEVRTVCLLTNTRLDLVQKIYLDRDSRTSQLLTRILCDQFWSIEVEFEEIDVRALDAKNLLEGEAVLMIGDKVFEKEKAFRFNFDLGEEWQRFSGLPFAFAVWISRKDLEESEISRLNRALGLGVKDMDGVLKKNANLATKIELSEYFERFIDYNYDVKKQKALSAYFEYAKKIVGQISV